MTEELQKQLDAIKPGKTYPKSVEITEKVNGKDMVVRFDMNSFYVGLYACVKVNGQLASQAGHTPKYFTNKLKKDIVSALARGATIEIGTISDIVTTI